MLQLHPDDVHTVKNLVRLTCLNRHTVERRLTGASYEQRERSKLYRLQGACQALISERPESANPGLNRGDDSALAGNARENPDGDREHAKVP